MTKLRTILLASIVGAATMTAASAAPVMPQIPNPANPHPAFPIATDGTPLPPVNGAPNAFVDGGVPYYDDF